jgi:hypothetical protein
MKKNYIYKILPLLLALLFNCLQLQKGNLFSQPVIQEWVKRYPDSVYGFNGLTDDIAVDDLGNSYITGAAYFNTYDNYCCTIKYKPNGDTAWTRLYSGVPLVGGKLTSAIAVDKSYNVYVTGYDLNQQNNFDFITIKYDSSGNQKWAKRFNGTANNEDIADAIAIDNAGNIYVTGYSSIGGSTFSICIIKYDKDGNELWVREYGSPAVMANGKSITVDKYCNIYITGKHNNLITFSYDSSGVLRWAQEYQLNYGSIGNSIALDTNNNVFITGYIGGGSDPQSPGEKYITIKYSNTGVQQWIRYYSYSTLQYPCDCEAFTISIDKDENIIVSGKAHFDFLPKSYFGIIKYSNSGDTIWERHLQMETISYYTDMTLDKFSNIYVTSGAADTTLYQHKHTYFTLKYDSSGYLLWTKRFSPNSYFASDATCIASDKNGNIYISGISGNLNSYTSDMCTIKYSQPLYSIKEIKKTMPNEYELFQNYPNPFNSTTKIRINVPKYVENNEVKIIIFDILGREIDNLAGRQLNPGNYETEWDASNYSSGVYFYQLNVDDFIQTKKMILSR